MRWRLFAGGAVDALAQQVGVAEGIAELTDRATGETVKIPLDEIAEHVRKTVAHAISGNA